MKKHLLRHRGEWLGLLLPMLIASGCAFAPERTEARWLAQLRLNDAFWLKRSDRWRIPSTTVMRVRSVNRAPEPGWQGAALAGLQYAFPRAALMQDSLGHSVSTLDGEVDLFLRWPEFDDHESRAVDPFIARLPDRLQRLLEPSADATISVVVLDRATGQLIEHSELRLRQQALRGRAEWPSLLTDAFTRYAAGLRSG